MIDKHPKHNIWSKLRIKFSGYSGTLRILYYRFLGMKIGRNTHVGKVFVEWPASIEIGNDSLIQKDTTFWIQSPFKNNKIVIGNNVFIGRNTEFNCCDYINIGNNCLIASSTVFVDSSHSIKKSELISKQPTLLKGIDIEEDVWIGTGSKILLGTRLGKGCIIGAGAIVNKSIPPYEIWAGVPARKIGERN